MKSIIEALAVTGVISHVCWLIICWLFKRLKAGIVHEREVILFNHARYNHEDRPFVCRSGDCKKLTTA
jgi:hypothetical protein